MKLKKLIFPILLLAMTSTVFMTACKKNEPIAFTYELIIHNANEPHTLVLDKFTSPIASISCFAL